MWQLAPAANLEKEKTSREPVIVK